MTPTGHILVVDDDGANRDIMSRRLSRAGHVVSTAPNGKAALDFLRNHSVDLVMLDVQMPEMSGLDVLREIRHTTGIARLPVVLVTARALPDDVQMGLSLGADDYITKPVDFSVILACVRAQLSRKTAGS